ncbi:multiple organellar RNA editing factor 7, mitochondrial-like [Bidens hawaiensis]|uniref:multiple organellar RNA editing factor 7, mitochondrial-like n=1 Tax=Bidens hawaiensis TaxID=980011 RepID=UPI00404AF52E
MMRRTFRLPVTFVSQYLGRVTSAAPTRCCSSIPQTRSVELDQAATPVDGCDYKHWLVVMDPPVGYPLRYQIVERYIQTLASALGSEEEAKKSMYSVSTKYYYAFGCKVDENVIHRVKSMPNVRWILPDSHISRGNNDYGGEPFIDGCVVPYDDIFHEDWLQDRNDNGFRRRTRSKRSRRKEDKTDRG